ncbi:MAG: YicC/YloC family endoribonuclease, partial [Bryobacteraceae bacterium]|nr:YicC/YloC family endoribonuclease [Bryobacteraceae bacterium]
MTLRSMTGFARVRDTIAGIDVVLSIKSVNHRGLDTHFYTGAEFDPFENAMRSALKRFVNRGHLDIRTQLTRADSSGPLAVDMAKLDAYTAAFRA